MTLLKYLYRRWINESKLVNDAEDLYVIHEKEVENKHGFVKFVSIMDIYRYPFCLELDELSDTNESDKIFSRNYRL